MIKYIHTILCHSIHSGKPHLTYPEHLQGGVRKKPEISRTKKPSICQGKNLPPKEGQIYPLPGPTPVPPVPLLRLRINPSVAPEALAGATGRPLTSCSLNEDGGCGKGRPPRPGKQSNSLPFSGRFFGGVTSMAKHTLCLHF